MKSTIRVDFQGPDTSTEGFEPAIRVTLEDSEDVRDRLLNSLFQSLGGDSSWLRVKYENRIDPNDKKTYVTLTPVKWYELDEELKVMNSRIERSDG